MDSAKKKQSISREQAGAIYDDLQQTMSSLIKKHGGKLPPVSKAEKKSQRVAAPRGSAPVEPKSADKRVIPEEHPGLPLMLPTKTNRGHVVALGLLVTFATLKVMFAVLEASGVFGVSAAQASIGFDAAGATSTGMRVPFSEPRTPTQPFSREELSVLTSLDHRRSELEERSQRLDQREADLQLRDREYLARQTQLKELTDKLQAERGKNDKKRNGQIDQLANVYGSMNPPEAATLIEQLDVQIALELLERMPEKRIGQILSLMNRERALTITRMLSGKGERTH